MCERRIKCNWPDPISACAVCGFNGGAAGRGLTVAEAATGLPAMIRLAVSSVFNTTGASSVFETSLIGVGVLDRNVRRGADGR